MANGKPKAGDYWEFKLPGKQKRTKEVGSVGKMFGKRADGTEGNYDYVYWQREPKGRYSGISVYLLLKHGRRVSTKAERDTHLSNLIAIAREKRAQEKREREAQRESEQKGTSPTD